MRYRWLDKLRTLKQLLLITRTQSPLRQFSINIYQFLGPNSWMHYFGFFGNFETLISHCIVLIRVMKSESVIGFVLPLSELEHAIWFLNRSCSCIQLFIWHFFLKYLSWSLRHPLDSSNRAWVLTSIIVPIPDCWINSLNSFESPLWMFISLRKHFKLFDKFRIIN